jgi:hypothetical protein
LKGAFHWTQSNHCSSLNKFLMLIVRCDSSTQQFTQNFDYHLLLPRQHSGSYLVLALKAETWTCELTIGSPKGINHAHWMNLLNMNLVNLKFWLSSLKPLFTMYISQWAFWLRMQWQYIVVRSRKRRWYLHCKKCEEAMIPML